MGKLLDAVAAEARPQGPRCGVGRLLTDIPKDVRADLLAAFDSPATATAIARALHTLGYKIGHYALQRHRRGDCGCGRAS